MGFCPVLRCSILTLALVSISSLEFVRGQELPIPKEVAQIEQAMQAAIAEVEPSVVTILVSRSDAFRTLFHDQPLEDSPGKLGGFNPRAVPQSKGSTISSETARKYDLADPDHVPEASGSGVVIDGKELLVLTTYHLLRDATKIYVRIDRDRGSYADIHAADPRSDLAVLHLLDEKLRPLKEIKFGDASAARKGQIVATVANPFASGFRDGSPSASWGIISNFRQGAAEGPLEEDKQRALYLLATLLQTDAPLNRGVSGGALINLKGEMIGLTTARAAVMGGEAAGGLAVPIDANFKRVIARLREGAEVEYGFMGVHWQRSGVRGQGLRLDQVVGGSPADKAGLGIGDCLLSINGIPVKDDSELLLTIAMLPPGSETRVVVRNREQPIAVTLAKHYVPGKAIVSKKLPDVRGLRVDYTSVLLTQGEGLQAPFQRREVLQGVYVREVLPASRAAAAKLQVNDIITHVNDQKVDNPSDFYRAAARIPANAPLELMLISFDWGRSYRSTKVVVP
jgi:S1-C subfamily serine protease